MALASLFLLQYQERFLAKYVTRDIFLGTQEFSSTGYRDLLCHGVTQKKKERLISNRTVTVTFFFSSTGIPYRMDTGKTRVLKKIPGTGISKNLGTGRKYGTFFGPFLGSIFGHFLPLLTKRIKKVHFWEKTMCLYLTSLFFLTTFWSRVRQKFPRKMCVDGS